jgi:hypothetical protein
MLVIKREQMAQFEEYVKSRFIQSILEEHVSSDYNQIKHIVDEAMNYKIESEILVAKYIELYLQNIAVFTSKPSWMLNVLQNEFYTNEDKLSHVERNINYYE